MSLCRESNYLALARSFLTGTSELVSQGDFENSIAKLGMPSMLRGNAMAVKESSWSDIGGLVDVKTSLRRLIEWPMRYRASFKRLGLSPPRGILLYGPPGCSKTSLVKVHYPITKVIASVSKASFFPMAASSMFSSLVGESEAGSIYLLIIVRALFRNACAASPSIIFLDEMEALVGKRSFGGSSGDAVQERILSALLNEMDGIENVANVLVLVIFGFIKGATNRPDLIDAALLRPGRFDKVIYVYIKS